jgi:2-polyprenyl-3-methyl-5-hydroxy-6-metoxy-1,4-benzoquinol methylase
MNEFWNNRYSTEEYAYGTLPNEFYKEEAKKLKPGTILFPAEGEGRNAVHAALLGWEVYAFDVSTEAKLKAEKLADRNQVTIHYTISSVDEVKYPEAYFDCIVLIFAHFPSQSRNSHHQKLLKFLKPGGIMILEGFSKKQIKMNSGGPKDPDMLFSRDELENDFSSLSTLRITEAEYILNEGKYHQGSAAVIRLTGKK